MGWCALTVDATGSQRIENGVCTGVERCIEEVSRHIQGAPAGAGIDAPLYWVRKGDRISDKRIRGAVVAAGGQSGTVSHVNSLRGACLVQGVLAAVMLSQRWPSITVTEAHPKALLRVWQDAHEFVAAHSFPTEHERDAALGAYAARAYRERRSGWVDWFTRETDPFVPGPYRVAYWFPECPELHPRHRGV